LDSDSAGGLQLTLSFETASSLPEISKSDAATLPTRNKPIIDKINKAFRLFIFRK
jgi:hypothetical protein